MNSIDRKVVVGISGGVDSAVTAYLLQKEGYTVTGMTMQTWDGEDERNNTVISDAKAVCDALGIRHTVISVTKEFEQYVIINFIKEYEKGRTPNPCLLCNPYVKWHALMKAADENGADYVATGHYANVVCTKEGRYTLKRQENGMKDQTYALYRLTQAQLAKTLMPLGNYQKDEIRRFAEEAGLPVAKKPDSMEICFIPDGDYVAFLKKHTTCGTTPGDFVSESGEKLGKHKGIIHYTVGQRKGLGIAFGTPMFVKELRPSTNEVVLGTNEQVFRDSLTADNLSYMAMDETTDSFYAYAKIRYNHTGAMCRVKITDGLAKVTFDEPQRAVTPGQAVVFYNEQKEILCGGTIC